MREKWHKGDTRNRQMKRTRQGDEHEERRRRCRCRSLCCCRRGETSEIKWNFKLAKGCESLLVDSAPCWPCGNLVENLHGSVADAWADKPPKPKRKQKQKQYADWQRRQLGAPNSKLATQRAKFTRKLPKCLRMCWVNNGNKVVVAVASAQCGCCYCTLLTAVGVGRGLAAPAAVINEWHNECECECEYKSECECECGCGCSCVQRRGKSRAQVPFVCVNSNQKANSNLNPHSTPSRNVNVNCNVSFINQQKSHFQLLRIRTDTVKPATTTAITATRSKSPEQQLP